MTFYKGFDRIFGNTGVAFVLTIGLFGFSVTGGPTDAEGKNLAEAPIVTIATIPARTERVTRDKDRPGWLVELFNAVEPIAGVEFKYVFVSWDQALRMLRAGQVDAVFNSSYKSERTVYGAYPMKDGKPDASRATVEYNYSFFTFDGSSVDWDGNRLVNLDGAVGVEKSAAILTELNELGISVQEVRDYVSLVSLLAGRRLSAIVGVDDIVDAAIRRDKARFGEIRKLAPPLQSRVGYLMFAKRYCDGGERICQAVWDAIGQVRRSDAFQTVRARYGGD